MVEVSAGKYAIAAGDCYANGVINYRELHSFSQSGWFYRWGT